MTDIEKLRMKSGLFIFERRGSVDLTDPDSSAIPLGMAQGWMADFALAEIARAEADLRARLVAEMKSAFQANPTMKMEDAMWNTALAKCIEIVRGESKES